MSVDENKDFLTNGVSIRDGEDSLTIQIKLLQQIKKELKDQTTLLQQILAKP